MVDNDQKLLEERYLLCVENSTTYPLTRADVAQAKQHAMRTIFRDIENYFGNESYEQLFFQACKRLQDASVFFSSIDYEFAIGNRLSNDDIIQILDSLKRSGRVSTAFKVAPNALIIARS